MNNTPKKRLRIIKPAKKYLMNLSMLLNDIRDYRFPVFRIIFEFCLIPNVVGNGSREEIANRPQEKYQASPAESHDGPSQPFNEFS